MKKPLFLLAALAWVAASQAQPAGYVSLDAFEPVNAVAAPAAARAPQATAPARLAPLPNAAPAPAATSAPSAATLPSSTTATVSGTFDAVRGASLRGTLEQWARQAGWQPLTWKLPEDTDFTLGASARFDGDFITATRNFVAALGSEAQLRVRFNQGNRLAVVEPLQ